MSWQAAHGVSLEMAAVNNGFDLEQPTTPPWRAFASSKAPLKIWLAAESPTMSILALSQRNVASELGGFEDDDNLPMGACCARAFANLAVLTMAVRRAFQLAQALPDEPLHLFLARTKNLPKTTEAERLVVQRVGQDIFRDGLRGYWQDRCALTGLAVTELLRASHIKPWADCDTDVERLDVFNGLLLAPHLDAAFDQGFITLDDDGKVIISSKLPLEAQRWLGLDEPLEADLKSRHRYYLEWHRDKVYRA